MITIRRIIGMTALGLALIGCNSQTRNNEIVYSPRESEAREIWWPHYNREMPTAEIGRIEGEYVAPSFVNDMLRSNSGYTGRTRSQILKSYDLNGNLIIEPDEADALDHDTKELALKDLIEPSKRH